MSVVDREPDPVSSSSDDDSDSDEEPMAIATHEEPMAIAKHGASAGGNSDSDNSSSDDKDDVRRAEARMTKGFDDDFSSEEEEEEVYADDSSSEDEKNKKPRTKNKNDDDDDDKWSDEDDSEAEESEEDNQNDEKNQSLSLQERLQHQEERQSSMTTTSALKHRRDRQKRAIPIAKERLQAFKKKQQKQTNNDEESNDSDSEDDGRKSGKKRKSKHAPTEVSSRRKSRYNNRSLNESGIGVQIGSNRYQPRDPRMSSLSGHLDAQQFEKNFGFLDDMQLKEVDTLKRKLRSLQKTGQKGRRERKKLGVTADDTAGSLQERLQQVQTAVARKNQDRLERQTKKAVKQKIHSQVAEGKGGMYFPKRQEMKRLHMEAKVEEIKKQSGKHGLDKYLAKKRKKQKSIHAKKMRSAGAGFVGDRNSFGKEED